MEVTDILNRRLNREKAARLQAEAILEQKALALYYANNQLQHLNDNLAQQVQEKLAELNESEERYRQLIESVEDIIYKISYKGFFTFVSPVVEKLLGYTEAEIICKHFTRFVANSHHQVIIDFYAGMLKAGYDSTYYEFPAVAKDGHTVWIGQTVRPIISQSGQVTELVAVARDVTGRKEAERELAGARHAAEEAQRAEKQFLTNMSHEIRTPLNAIIGMSHLLFDTQPSRQQREYIGILKTSADFLHSLISDLLDMTKIEAGRLEVSPRPFDLAGLLRATHKVFEIKLRDRPVRVDAMVDTRLTGDFVGDDLMLNQILTNLIGNAEKFTETGSIELTARIVEEDETVCWVEFRVSDTGVGIPDEMQEMIFRKFRQVNPQGHKYKGTGLGLAITKELVEIQKGTITVRSQAGQGSTFTVRLPYVRATAPEGGEPSQPGQPRTPIGRVLVVEDNLMNQTYISSLLNKWNVSFTLASDGKVAVEKAKEEAFALILMDIQMPIMDGYEATVAIRSTNNPNQHVPIIALTASAMLDHRKIALEVGMNDFLTKPFEPAQLLKILERYASVSAAQVPADAGGPLNRQLLHEFYGTDRAYAADMFGIFLNDVVPELLRFPQLSRQPDRTELKAMAHKLKPTLSMVGLTSIETELNLLEIDLTTGTDEIIGQRCQTIADQLTYQLPALKTELQLLSATQP